MRVFTVHVHRLGIDPVRDIAVVKEGFCWPAFVFTVLWALWHRLWGVALAFFAIQFAAGVAAAALNPSGVTDAILSIALAACFGYVANDLRRRALARRGFEWAGVVAAADRDTALRRFLDAHPELSFGMGA